MALNLGAVKPHVQAAAEEIASRFQITTIGGWRAVGSVPDSDHPKGLAIDVMVVGPKSDMVEQYAVANAQRLGITYIIHNRRIWQDGKWTPYSGPSPHTDHVHISFAAAPGTGGAPVAGSESGGNADLPGCIGSLLKAFGIGGVST
jgi:hypothetical protein